MSERAHKAQGTHKGGGWPEPTVLAASAMKQGVRASRPPVGGGAGPIVDRKQRDARGHYLPGNVGGPGHPLAGKVAKLRAALLTAIRTEDIQAIAEILIEKALGGDLQAIKEVLDRTIGKAVAPIIAEIGGSEPIGTRVIFDYPRTREELKRAGVEIIGGPSENRITG